MPPSSNNCYVTSRSGHRFPSRELKAFKSEMLDWSKENLEALTRAIDEFRAPMKTEQRFIRMDRYFIFPRERVLCLDGTAKKLDASNRIKCLDDSLSDILGIDDCWFSSGYTAKLIGKEPSVSVCLTTEEYGLMTEEELHSTGWCWAIPWAVYFQRMSKSFPPVTRQGAYGKVKADP